VATKTAGPDAAPRGPIREQRRSLVGLGERHGIADRPPTLPPGDLRDAPGDGPAIRGGQGDREGWNMLEPPVIRC